MPLLKCDDCGKEISPSAPACPNCGRPQGAVSTAPPAKKQRTTAESALLAVAGVGLFLFLAHQCSNETNTSGESASAESASPPAAAREIYKTTAEDLYQMYAKNEVAADRDIGNRFVEVKGTIVAIDKDFMEHAVVQLETSNDLSHVGLTLDDSQKSAAASLSKGRVVTIRCDKMSRVVDSPQGTDCTLVK